MIRVSASVCIDAPAATVWSMLFELESIHLWAPGILRSHCVGTQARGVGAVRMCELRGDIRVRETMVAWNEGQSFAYIGEGAPLMARATNRSEVDPQGSQTLVTTSAEIALKDGIVGRWCEPLVKPLITRMGAQSLAAFKYLVENGQPYARNTRRLFPIPTRC
jgi:carbon monoxide dehydrogenase subunit G